MISTWLLPYIICYSYLPTRSGFYSTDLWSTSHSCNFFIQFVLSKLHWSLSLNRLNHSLIATLVELHVASCTLHDSCYASMKTNWYLPDTWDWLSSIKPDEPPRNLTSFPTYQHPSSSSSSSQRITSPSSVACLLSPVVSVSDWRARIRCLHFQFTCEFPCTSTVPPRPEFIFNYRAEEASQFSAWEPSIVLLTTKVLDYLSHTESHEGRQQLPVWGYRKLLTVSGNIALGTGIATKPKISKQLVKNNGLKLHTTVWNSDWQ